MTACLIHLFLATFLLFVFALISHLRQQLVNYIDVCHFYYLLFDFGKVQSSNRRSDSGPIWRTLFKQYWLCFRFPQSDVSIVMFIPHIKSKRCCQHVYNSTHLLQYQPSKYSRFYDTRVFLYTKFAETFMKNMKKLYKLLPKFIHSLYAYSLELLLILMLDIYSVAFYIYSFNRLNIFPNITNTPNFLVFFFTKFRKFQFLNLSELFTRIVCLTTFLNM